MAKTFHLSILTPERLFFEGDVEKLVLARSLRYHVQDRVIIHQNKTVVFS